VGRRLWVLFRPMSSGRCLWKRPNCLWWFWWLSRSLPLHIKFILLWLTAFLDVTSFAFVETFGKHLAMQNGCRHHCLLLVRCLWLELVPCNAFIGIACNSAFEIAIAASWCLAHHAVTLISTKLVSTMHAIICHHLSSQLLHCFWLTAILVPQIEMLQLPLWICSLNGESPLLHWDKTFPFWNCVKALWITFVSPSHSLSDKCYQFAFLTLQTSMLYFRQCCFFLGVILAYGRFWAQAIPGNLSVFLI